MALDKDNIAIYDQEIKKVCPIDGLSSDGRISYRPEATAGQRAAALQVLATLDPDTIVTPVKQAVIDKQNALDKIDNAKTKATLADVIAALEAIRKIL